jgi:NAD(P)-dependent dehydrogenase (short-subunit alcohol dehydrogenase family)
MKNLMKTVLVTGGNRGIGLEICRQLDGSGHRVIMGSRDLEKGLKAAGSLSKNVIVKQLDVTNEESLRNLFNFVKTQFGLLDVLINNAGINKDPESSETSLAGKAKNIIETNLPGARPVIKAATSMMRNAGIIIRRKTAGDVPLVHVKYIMETNFYGAWRTIQVFIPLLRKSNDARIINISSGMGELKSLTGDYPGYRLSKASLNALTIMFSNELKDDGIKVNAICPGWVRTDMGGPDAPRSVSEGADTAVWLATEESNPTGKFFRDRKEIEW